MACKKCGAPCGSKRFCQTHRIENAHEGTEATEGTRRTLTAQREARARAATRYYFVCRTCASDPDHKGGHELLTGLERFAEWAVNAHADHDAEYVAV